MDASRPRSVSDPGGLADGLRLAVLQRHAPGVPGFDPTVGGAGGEQPARNLAGPVHHWAAGLAAPEPGNDETPASAGVPVQSGYGESNSGIQLGKLEIGPCEHWAVGRLPSVSAGFRASPYRPVTPDFVS